MHVKKLMLALALTALLPACNDDAPPATTGDAFTRQVVAVSNTTSETSEPIDIAALVETTPEDTEPVPF